jgi:hypothetical protein
VTSHDATRRVLIDVHAERVTQTAKWGRQDHLDLTPGSCKDPATLADVARDHLMPPADHVQQMVDRLADEGRLSWALIALEELAEALEAAALLDGTSRSVEMLRCEVVQLAAVAVAWVEAIDRRAATS